MDGGSRVTAGYFTHQAINLKLQRLVAAWSRPWRRCMPVLLITVPVGRQCAQSSCTHTQYEGHAAASHATTLAGPVEREPWQPPRTGQAWDSV